MAHYIIDIKGDNVNIHIEGGRLHKEMWESLVDVPDDIYVRVKKVSFFGLVEQTIFEKTLLNATKGGKQ